MGFRISYSFSIFQFEHISQLYICDKKIAPLAWSGMHQKRTATVDHNHQTNEVRGLLCYRCNMCLGACLENRGVLARMIYYLDEFGNNSEEDAANGFFKPINEQIDMACKKFASDSNLVNGFNAIGFSQGGQFLRAYIQRCNKPPVFNLITLGAQHQGVFGFPRCPVGNIICEEVRKLLEIGAYEKHIQKKVVQAQYWKDPFHYANYLKISLFLNDINNELDVKNETYKKNLASINQFTMVKFLKDSMVTPRDSSWFEFYKLGQDKIIEPLKNSTLYQQDLLGLKHLDDINRLQFLTCDGDHLHFTQQWFEDNIIPLINNYIPLINNNL